MKVLIIKMSSLGDILHTLPAITDAKQAMPSIQFDWVVEEAFQEVPTWHSAVNKVIPIALRRWRKAPLRALLNHEFRRFLKQLRQEKYDYIIDAQGLLKSAIVTYLAKGTRVGLDKNSLTEPIARFAYQNTIEVDLCRQAVWRMRTLFAKIFQYDRPTSEPDYGLVKENFKEYDWSTGGCPQSISSCDKHTTQSQLERRRGYIVFAHGTTWQSKHWPDKHWITLANLIKAAGMSIKITWGTESERLRTEKMKQACDAITVLPKMHLKEVASLLIHSKAVVAVDTGLAHMAAAFNVPVLTMYGPTDPKRTGTVGQCQTQLLADFLCILCDNPTCAFDKHAASACLESITPEMIWQKLQQSIQASQEN